MGRRRRPGREHPFVWWIGFAVLGIAALALRSWRLALITLLLWCLYEFALVPTVCRVRTRKGQFCPEPARGRLFACGTSHQRVKTDALRRLARLPGKRRSAPPADPNRDTGVVVYSAEVRGRLSQEDRAFLALAAAGTVVTVVGMLYGLT
ncbi:hypothetical protein [Actinomadura craniellae]|nr:hypothetical protein [Actinomadura craniellae]